METHEIETLVGELETRVDRLRSLYEQYFMGIEKMAPAVPQKDVERRIQTLRKEQIRNTAVRFRFQMILQRYNTYQTHWMRICRQIEEGTYKRDILRAQRRLAPKPAVGAERDASIDVAFSTAPPAPAKEQPPETATPAPAKVPEPPRSGALPKAPPLPPKPAPRPATQAHSAQAQPAAPAVIPARAPPAVPLGSPEASAKRPPPLPARAAQQAPARPASGDLTDDRLRQLYTQYVQTRRAQNESTAALTYDAMAKSLCESSEKLREKHGKSVDFEVTVKDGKTILRPVVKR